MQELKPVSDHELESASKDAAENAARAVSQEGEGQKKRQPPSSAFDRILYFLGRRNHSEKELRRKLRGKFEPEEFERALTKAKEWRLLPHDDDSAKVLAEQFSRALHRKNKGLLFIQGYLRQRGLPNIDRDRNLELEKAESLLKNLGQKTREQANRFYIARGFERDIIAEVLRKKKWPEKKTVKKDAL